MRINMKMKIIYKHKNTHNNEIINRTKSENKNKNRKWTLNKITMKMNWW